MRFMRAVPVPLVNTLGKGRGFGHIGHMRRTSLAEAKAHLSAFVDEAEHHHKRTLILRHGKPAAAIVPLDFAEAPGRSVAPSRPKLTVAEVDALFAAFESVSPHQSAVEDLLAGRR